MFADTHFLKPNLHHDSANFFSKSPPVLQPKNRQKIWRPIDSQDGMTPTRCSQSKPLSERLSHGVNNAILPHAVEFIPQQRSEKSGSADKLIVSICQLKPKLNLQDFSRKNMHVLDTLPSQSMPFPCVREQMDQQYTDAIFDQRGIMNLEMLLLRRQAFYEEANKKLVECNSFLERSNKVLH